VTGNRWKLIYAWVNKEFKNLDRYMQAGIPVPEPITFAQNCLLMEYIGDETGPAPQLKDVVLEDPDETYEDVLSFIIDGWQEAHLVHGDLSEYNILMTEDGPIMIDVGQAMTKDHYNAKELLERDIHNINSFFRKRDADVMTDAEVLEETLSDNGDEEE
ncbi:MAG: phosphotransferase, partial [Candidatus Methanomethylophilaceae archaeon]|nr:phosphotransferase [Candidatus Methanomethylophilaceae archaeon]